MNVETETDTSMEEKVALVPQCKESKYGWIYNLQVQSKNQPASEIPVEHMALMHRQVNKET
jgi:hypothetical protein